MVSDVNSQASQGTIVGGAVQHFRLIVIFWLGVAFVVAMLSLSQAKPPEKRMLYSDVSTHVMIASSIWHDWDIKYSLEDLARFRADFPVESGPRGVFLKQTPSGDFTLAKPYLYGAAAAGFYGWIGVDGFILLNSISLFVIGLIITLALRFKFGTVWALVASLGLVLPSPFLAWVSVPHPDLFIAALLAAACYLIMRAGVAVSWKVVLGALVLGAAIHEKPVFVILLPFMLLAISGPRSLGRYAVVVLGSALSWFILSAPNLFNDGTLVAYQGARFYTGHAPFPLETGWTRPVTRGVTDHIFTPELIVNSLFSNLMLVPEKLIDFIVGRQTGILVYFPVALLLLLIGVTSYLGAGLWLMAGFFAYLGLNWLAFPTNGYGGCGSYGPRYMMQALSLIPLMFMSFRSNGQRLLVLPWKMALVAACLAATLLHYRAFAFSDQLVQQYYSWFVKKPLTWFPAENWLLSCAVTDAQLSASKQEMLFNKTQLAVDERTPSLSMEKSVLFQYGKLSTVEFELWPAHSSDDVILKNDQKVLWQGKLGHGQPVQLKLNRLDFNVEAFDLLSAQPVRYVELEMHRRNMPQTNAMPLLGFIREFKKFSAFDQAIKASELTSAGIVLLRGWSGIEPWGVWTNGELAQIAIRVGENQGPYEVVLRMHAYVPPNDPMRKVRLSYNGRTVNEQVFRAGDDVLDWRFQVHTELGEEYLTLSFDIDNPVSPAMLGRNADSRKLGIGLHSVKLIQNKELMDE